MITISNSQRDDILRYLDLLCDAYSKQRNNRAHNICRRAGILRRQLAAKEPFSLSDMPGRKGKSRQ